MQPTENKVFPSPIKKKALLKLLSLTNWFDFFGSSQRKKIFKETSVSELRKLNSLLLRSNIYDGLKTANGLEEFVIGIKALFSLGKEVRPSISASTSQAFPPFLFLTKGDTKLPLHKKYQQMIEKTGESFNLDSFCLHFFAWRSIDDKLQTISLETEYSDQQKSFDSGLSQSL